MTKKKPCLKQTQTAGNCLENYNEGRVDEKLGKNKQKDI